MSTSRINLDESLAKATGLSASRFPDVLHRFYRMGWQDQAQLLHESRLLAADREFINECQAQNLTKEQTRTAALLKVSKTYRPGAGFIRSSTSKKRSPRNRPTHPSRVFLQKHLPVIEELRSQGLSWEAVQRYFITHHKRKFSIRLLISVHKGRNQ
ncbi:hypothetical protein Selin_1439 [Desulfurispirillum indicum S5]|uniref:Uncharacterized protein n=1 Tax=Desulfurispirillum indicum (strain ATCC BAA-1389 / DSM 22839 / S5) TaxID=653733 RepID=E6W6T0_DESIS|nr:hypothetical protein [Desulfurispirillum indicum]ADU66173.1 hypothetical protein Selin_1439 [Desulfurispirillum indicum S5]